MNYKHQAELNKVILEMSLFQYLNCLLIDKKKNQAVAASTVNSTFLLQTYLI